MFITLIISILGLVLIFTWKFWEIKTDKVLISKETLDKSDALIKQNLSNTGKKTIHLLNKASKVPTKAKGLDIYVIKYRNIIIKKIFDLFKINNRLDINKKKGAVSIFLQTISEDKQKNRE